MRNRKWNEHEVALLIELYVKSHSADKVKSYEIENLSNTLRLMAFSQGEETEESFGNISGVTTQLYKIEKIFVDGTKKDLHCGEIFIKMVQMYKFQRTRFDRILAEAKARAKDAEGKAESKPKAKEKSESAVRSEARSICIDKLTDLEGITPVATQSFRSMATTTTWKEVYLRVLNDICYSRPTKICKLCGNKLSINNGSSPDICTERYLREMRRPTRIGLGLYAESNLAPLVMLENLVYLIKAVHLDINKFTILYIGSNSTLKEYENASGEIQCNEREDIDEKMGRESGSAKKIAEDSDLKVQFRSEIGKLSERLAEIGKKDSGYYLQLLRNNAFTEAIYKMWNAENVTLKEDVLSEITGADFSIWDIGEIMRALSFGIEPMLPHNYYHSSSSLSSGANSNLTSIKFDTQPSSISVGGRKFKIIKYSSDFYAFELIVKFLQATLGVDKVVKLETDLYYIRDFTRIFSNDGWADNIKEITGERKGIFIAEENVAESITDIVNKRIEYAFRKRYFAAMLNKIEGILNTSLSNVGYIELPKIIFDDSLRRKMIREKIHTIGDLNKKLQYLHLTVENAEKLYEELAAFAELTFDGVFSSLMAIIGKKEGEIIQTIYEKENVDLDSVCLKYGCNQGHIANVIRKGRMAAMSDIAIPEMAKFIYMLQVYSDYKLFISSEKMAQANIDERMLIIADKIFGVLRYDKDTQVYVFKDKLRVYRFIKAEIKSFDRIQLTVHPEKLMDKLHAKISPLPLNDITKMLAAISK